MIYENISQLCKERGISVKELERRVGLANGAVSKWRTASPNVDSLKRVADHFGTGLDALVSSAAASDTSFRKGSICFRGGGTDLFGGSFGSIAELSAILAEYGGGRTVEVIITDAEVEMGPDVSDSASK